jgi:hypothetical protein
VKVYECPNRDFELKVNDDDALEGDMRFCPTHYVPLVQRVHDPQLSREVYENKDGSVVWHSLQEPGRKAYEPAEEK